MVVLHARFLTIGPIAICTRNSYFHKKNDCVVNWFNIAWVYSSIARLFTNVGRALTVSHDAQGSKYNMHGPCITSRVHAFPASEVLYRITIAKEIRLRRLTTLIARSLLSDGNSPDDGEGRRITAQSENVNDERESHVIMARSVATSDKLWKNTKPRKEIGFYSDVAFQLGFSTTRDNAIVYAIITREINKIRNWTPDGPRLTIIAGYDGPE